MNNESQEEALEEKKINIWKEPASALRNGDDRREEDRNGVEGRAIASHVA